MSRAQLTASRKLWRNREVYRYKKWRHYQRTKDSAGRKKWYALYSEARAQRKHRDAQLASLSTFPVKAAPLIARFEGFSSTVYRDAVGVATQGYGETQGIQPGKKWSRAYALARLVTRLRRDYWPTIKALNLPTANMRAAYVSFVYNCGVGAVGPNTTVGRLLRQKRWTAAANAMLEWNKGGGRVLQGLVNRRQAERRLALL